MSAADVFPITLACNGKGWSAFDYRDTFLSHKPKDASWYGYDVVIHDREEVEFVAYNIRDCFSGGLGNEAFRFKVGVPRHLTKKDVERRLWYLAEERRMAELAAQEKVIVSGYADDLRAALDAGATC